MMEPTAVDTADHEHPKDVPLPPSAASSASSSEDKDIDTLEDYPH